MQLTGSYAYYQHHKTKPNIFDTRETFFLKIHNPETRAQFVDFLEYKRLRN